jgi:cytochrome c nitrite reductase small subunit
MSKKRTVVIAVLLGVVVIGGVGAIGFWTYHGQPQFCATCHIMEPYLESWRSSDYGAAAHGEQGVTCLDCHEPTTQQQMDELVVYMTGDFTVPLEQRDFGDDFCFDCHLPNEHASEEEVIQLTAGLEVNPHESHLVGEMDCETCHKMHGLSEDYCAQCHGPLSSGAGWTTEVTLPAGVAVWTPDMDCTVCHVMDPYVESLDNPDLLAYAHAQQGLECLDCHEPIELQTIHEQAVAGTPVKALTVDNQFCFDCHVTNEHTSWQQIIQRTEGYTVQQITVNPHDPHPGVESNQDDLGPYECSSCHKMHETSALISYCTDCHHSVPRESCRAECHLGEIPSFE